LVGFLPACFGHRLARDRAGACLAGIPVCTSFVPFLQEVPEGEKESGLQKQI
jgi:hypothetical protein